MKLVREAIKLGNEYNGKWYFIIYDDNAEKLEKVEDALRAMETGASVGGKVMTWENYRDGCPCYNDGFGSGFWVDVEDVPAFKAAWKIAKKMA